MLYISTVVQYWYSDDRVRRGRLSARQLQRWFHWYSEWVSRSSASNAFVSHLSLTTARALRTPRYSITRTNPSTMLNRLHTVFVSWRFSQLEDAKRLLHFTQRFGGRLGVQYQLPVVPVHLSLHRHRRWPTRKRRDRRPQRQRQRGAPSPVQMELSAVREQSTREAKRFSYKSNWQWERVVDGTSSILILWINITGLPNIKL